MPGALTGPSGWSGRCVFVCMFLIISCLCLKYLLMAFFLSLHPSEFLCFTASGAERVLQATVCPALSGTQNTLYKGIKQKKMASELQPEGRC